TGDAHVLAIPKKRGSVVDLGAEGTYVRPITATSGVVLWPNVPDPNANPSHTQLMRTRADGSSTNLFASFAGTTEGLTTDGANVYAITGYDGLVALPLGGGPALPLTRDLTTNASSNDLTVRGADVFF